MRAELINYMGSDLMVVDAARVSFNKESEWKYACVADCAEHGFLPDSSCAYCEPVGLNERDQKLLSYLARHGHWTPFAHPQICIRETVPVFVARQRFKHVIGFVYNEVSRRYVDDDPSFYTPVTFRRRPNGGIKQGSGDAIEEGSEYYQEYLDRVHELALRCYTDMLKDGIAPEQARMCLPQSMYTSYYVTGSLAAWARAYKQRSDPHAQAEIRDLAKQWDDIISPLFPKSWEALNG